MWFIYKTDFEMMKTEHNTKRVDNKVDLLTLACAQEIEEGQ
jgi:hypothetical protein